MSSNFANPQINITNTKRVFPQRSPESTTPEQVIPLSLLEATTSNFGLTSAVWLFPSHYPAIDVSSPAGDHGPFTNLTGHLLQSLKASLGSYPQWCGQIKAITTLNENDLADETKTFPPHARRFGRLYARFNTPEDPGVEFITAASTATWEDLYPKDRTDPHKPHVWTGPECHSLRAFSPSTHVATMLAPHNFTGPETNPVLAIQVTQLSPVAGGGDEHGGFVVAAKAAHPLADITGLVQFIDHWATISRILNSSSQDTELTTSNTLGLVAPVFDPSLLDNQAAGDINAPHADPSILRTADVLPFHKFDWWMPGPDYPSHILQSHIPPAFQEQTLRNGLKPEGNPMPWSDWDITAPVSTSIIHFTPEQVDSLYRNQCQLGTETSTTLAKTGPSKHDALLAHIWSRIVTARNFTSKEDMTCPVYCNLTLGLRPALNLPRTFQGSPIIMVPVASTPHQLLGSSTGNSHQKPSRNGYGCHIIYPQRSKYIGTPPPSSGTDVPSTSNSNSNIPSLIRSTLTSITNPASGQPTNKLIAQSTGTCQCTNGTSSPTPNKILSTHLHSLAYSTSPQRIWQAFLGRRHTLVTSWAKSGIYNIDFGLGHGTALYVDGDLPVADGFVLIKEGGSHSRSQGPAAARDSESNDRSIMPVKGKEHQSLTPSGSGSGSWTDNGVDISVNLNNDHMRRLLGDPFLFPIPRLKS